MHLTTFKTPFGNSKADNRNLILTFSLTDRNIVKLSAIGHSIRSSRFLQQCNVVFYVNYEDLCSLLYVTSHFSILIGQNMQFDWLP